MLTVYDLNVETFYALGCETGRHEGKFTMRMGNPAGSDDAMYGAYDLHQLGAGYQGHLWFTHVYKADSDNTPNTGYQDKHQITATWTPDLWNQTGTQKFDIVAHLPSHGGEYENAKYYIFHNFTDSSPSDCTLDQGSGGLLGGLGYDHWTYLGTHELANGGRVQLKNIGGENATGTVDVAFDALAFIPIAGKGHSCGDDY